MIKFCKKCQVETERNLVDKKCKVCVKARSAAYYAEHTDKIKSSVAEYKQKNLEKCLAYDKTYRAENRETRNAASIAWQKKNKDRSNARKTKWAKEHPEKVKASAIDWNKSNPEALKLTKHARRARISRAGGSLSKGIEKKLFTLQNGKCPCCNKPLGIDYHIDHINPISRGGANIDSNVQLLRKRCNHQKNSKDPIDFMQSRGFLL